MGLGVSRSRNIPMGNSCSSTKLENYHPPTPDVAHDPALELHLLHFARSRLELCLSLYSAQCPCCMQPPPLYPLHSPISTLLLTSLSSHVVVSHPYRQHLCCIALMARLTTRWLPASSFFQRHSYYASSCIARRVFSRWTPGYANLQRCNPFSRRMAAALLALEIRPDAICISNLTGHTLPVSAISFNADASLAATCSHDSLIQLWRVQRDGSASCLATLTAHSNPVCDIAFSPCGRFFASCSMNAMIIVWALTSDSSCIIKSKLQHHSEAVFCICFSPKAGLLAAGSGDSRISLMRYDRDGSALLIHELLGHSSWVLSIAFHPSAAQLCSGAKDASIR